VNSQPLVAKENPEKKENQDCPENQVEAVCLAQMDLRETKETQA